MKEDYGDKMKNDKRDYSRENTSITFPEIKIFYFKDLGRLVRTENPFLINNIFVPDYSDGN